MQPLLLADIPIRLIVGIVFGVIWLINQIMAASAEAKSQQKKRLPTSGKSEEDVRREMERRLREALGQPEAARNNKRENRPPPDGEKNRGKKSPSGKKAPSKDESVAEHVREKFSRPERISLGQELAEREAAQDQQRMAKFARQVGELDNDDLNADISGISAESTQAEDLGRVVPSIDVMQLSEAMRNPQKFREALVMGLIMERPKI